MHPKKKLLGHWNSTADIDNTKLPMLLYTNNINQAFTPEQTGVTKTSLGKEIY